jgi:hypothetical protein
VQGLPNLQDLSDSMYSRCTYIENKLNEKDIDFKIFFALIPQNLTRNLYLITIKKNICSNTSIKYPICTKRMGKQIYE